MIKEEKIKVSDKNGRTASRNVVHLLANESYLHKWKDLGAGANMIEYLTKKVFDEIW